MRTIRRNVFETNSSSVHTLTLTPKGFEEPKLPIRRRKNEDGVFGKYVIGKLGTFNTGMEYHSQEDKLSYLLTLLYYDSRKDLNKMYESWDFYELEKVVKEYCKCDGLRVDPKSVKEAYIDQEELNEYFSLYSYLVMDIKDFLFNKYVSVKVDEE